KKGAAKGQTLREQAAQLLQVKMWGIGSHTPHRSALASGDLVLIYVGAPERGFIGHATVASAVSDWTPQEAQVYPGDFPSGVRFSEAHAWTHPISMKTILAELDLAKTNPQAFFMSGVVRITAHDYEAVTSAGSSAVPTAPPPAPPPTPVPESAPIDPD